MTPPEPTDDPEDPDALGPPLTTTSEQTDSRYPEWATAEVSKVERTMEPGGPPVQKRMLAVAIMALVLGVAALAFMS